MPEGDTVYLLARRLDRSLAGRTLKHAELRVPAHATADLSGQTILGHDTYGKHLLTRFDGKGLDEQGFDGGLTLHTHLEMEGSWTVTRDGKRIPSNLLPDVRVLLACTDGNTAYGIKLPVVELVETRNEAEVVGYLGPDPLREDFDPDLAAANLARDPDRALVAALLDQRNLAGLGNLWVNELAFLRGYSPWTPMRDVDIPATVALARRVLRHSALTPGALQVTTGNNRRGAEHWVSGRARDRCRRCGTRILVVAEVPNDPDRRRTWWCPRCQPGPGPDRDVVRYGS